MRSKSFNGLYNSNCFTYALDSAGVKYPDTPLVGQTAARTSSLKFAFQYDEQVITDSLYNFPVCNGA